MSATRRGNNCSDGNRNRSNCYRQPRTKNGASRLEPGQSRRPPTGSDGQLWAGGLPSLGCGRGDKMAL